MWSNPTVKSLIKAHFIFWQVRQTWCQGGGEWRVRGGGCVLNSVEQPHCQVSHQSSLHILAGEANMVSEGRGGSCFKSRKSLPYLSVDMSHE